MEELAGTIELVLAAISLLSVLVGGGMAVWRVINKINVKLSQALKTLDEVSKIVYYEFNPNGGSSARDAIDRIENSLVLLAQNDDFILIEVGVATFTTDTEGLFTSINREYSRLTGSSEEESLGNGWISTIHPDSFEEVTISWRQATEDRREWHCNNFQYLRPDGTTVSCRGHTYPTRNKDGEFSGYKGFIRRVKEPFPEKAKC